MEQRPLDSKKFLDLILKDGQLNVYRGEVEVRPPRAPTTGPNREALGRR
jgi:hypothetical protein